MSEPVEAEETVKCSACGTPVSFHRRTCHVCEEDVGFPNVRKAASEEAELFDRYSSAKASAGVRGVTKELEAFEAACAKSKSVWARSFNQVIELTKSENLLYATFGKQMAQNVRLAENNEWDPGREAAESAVHPYYSDQILESALSLTNLGLPSYGNCHIVFRSELIEKRASLFEENPFLFMERHKHITGKALPKGYRATWSNRGVLAVAKLHSKIEARMTDADYQNILILDVGGDADFIEVHIYGAIGARTFEKITFYGKPSAQENALLAAHRGNIEKLGIEIIEGTT